MSKTIRYKRVKKTSWKYKRHRKMRSYTMRPVQFKERLASYETKINLAGESFPQKKTQHMKDVIAAANRSQKKAVRQHVKREIAAILSECG